MSSLADKGRRVKLLEADAASLKKQADELKQEIKEEIEQLGIKTMVQDGVQITYVAPVEYYYPQEKLKEVLPKAVYKRLFKPVFDPSLLEGEVMAGNVDLKTIEPLLEKKEKKTSIRITFKGE